MEPGSATARRSGSTPGAGEVPGTRGVLSPRAGAGCGLRMTGVGPDTAAGLTRIGGGPGRAPARIRQRLSRPACVPARPVRTSAALRRRVPNGPSAGGAATAHRPQRDGPRPTARARAGRYRLRAGPGARRRPDAAGPRRGCPGASPARSRPAHLRRGPAASAHPERLHGSPTAVLLASVPRRDGTPAGPRARSGAGPVRHRGHGQFRAGIAPSAAPNAPSPARRRPPRDRSGARSMTAESSGTPADWNGRHPAA